MRLSTLIRFLLLPVLLAGLLTATTGTAQAENADKKKTLHEGYYSHGWLRLYEPNICLRYKLTGIKNYTARYIARDPVDGGQTYAYRIEDLNLSFNKLDVTGYRPNGSVCSTSMPRKNWSRISLKLYHRGFACDFNPSISVSFPWSIGASFWPSCGDRTLARLQGTSNVARSHHYLRDDEKVIKYTSVQEQGNFRSRRTDLKWTCYGASFWVGIEAGAGQNSKTGPKRKICLNWNGNTGIF